MLPASFVMLGAAIEAFQARKEGSAEIRRVLRSSTSWRGFAGNGHTRHWCCRLTRFIEFLFERGLLDPASLPIRGGPEYALFLSLGMTMKEWDAVASRSRLPARAHLRALVVQAAGQLALLLRPSDVARLEPILLPPRGTPAWAEKERRAEPIQELWRRTSTAPTLKALSDRIMVDERTVGRWFSKGERPSARFLSYLVGYFVKEGLAADQRALERILWWHYSLSELAERLSAEHGDDFVRELAAVLTATVRCAVVGAHNASLENKTPREMLLAAALLGEVPLPDMFEHAAQHGAASWRDDVIRVYVERGALLGPPGKPPALRLGFLLRHLPRRKPPRVVRRRLQRKRVGQ